MKLNKWVKTLTASTMILALVAGCGSNSGSGGNTPNTGSGGNNASTPPEEQKPITIQYWHAHPDTQTEGLDYIIEEFKKVEPNITIEPVYQGSYDDLAQKLLAAVSAKQVPAVTNVEVACLGAFLSR